MANNRTLTSANSRLYLSVATIYPTMQLLQGYTADDITDTDAVTPAQVIKGLDGRLSAGYIPVAVPQNITLQGDSVSNDLFENVFEYEKAASEKYVFTGLLVIPATTRQYNMTRGFLTSIPQTPALRNVIQPRRYTITWESITPSYS